MKDDPAYDPNLFSNLDVDLVFTMKEGAYYWSLLRKPSIYYGNILYFFPKFDSHRFDLFNNDAISSLFSR